MGQSMLKLGGKIIRIHAVDVHKDLTLLKVATSQNLLKFCDEKWPIWFLITRFPGDSHTTYCLKNIVSWLKCCLPTLITHSYQMTTATLVMVT